MNGPQHFRRAESLLALGSPDAEQRAQVHATLALAAATAETIAARGPGDFDVMWNPIFRGDPEEQA